jgi:hypothetical protein
MKWNWRKVATGLKIAAAANIAIDLNDAHVIKIKGIDKAKTIKDVLEKNAPKSTDSQ